MSGAEGLIVITVLLDAAEGTRFQIFTNFFDTFKQKK